MFTASICPMTELLMYEIVMIFMCTHQSQLCETTEFMVTERIEIFSGNNKSDEFLFQMLWYRYIFHSLPCPINDCLCDMASDLYVLGVTPLKVIEHMYFKGSVRFVVYCVQSLVRDNGYGQWQTAAPRERVGLRIKSHREHFCIISLCAENRPVWWIHFTECQKYETLIFFVSQIKIN